jgi:hypothetical protein
VWVVSQRRCGPEAATTPSCRAVRPWPWAAGRTASSRNSNGAVAPGIGQPPASAARCQRGRPYANPSRAAPPGSQGQGENESGTSGVVEHALDGRPGLRGWLVPGRYHNLAVIGLSVAICFLIGGIEVLSLIPYEINGVSQTHGFWGFMYNFNINTAGLVIVGSTGAPPVARRQKNDPG